MDGVTLRTDMVFFPVELVLPLVSVSLTQNVSRPGYSTNEASALSVYTPHPSLFVPAMVAIFSGRIAPVGVIAQNATAAETNPSVTMAIGLYIDPWLIYPSVISVAKFDLMRIIIYFSFLPRIARGK